MAKKLGYTWYPKDWGNSESVFELNLSERGLYRELIDIAMQNDNQTEIKKDVWSRKFAVSLTDLEDILSKLEKLGLIIYKKNILFIPSCESRLVFVRTGSVGGKNKGTVKGNDKGFTKGNEEGNVNQIESEREKETKIESESKNNIFLADLLNSQSWLESLAMNNQKKFNLIQVKEKLNLFTTELNLKFDFKQNKTEFTSHFVSWLNKQENTKVKPFFDSPA
jgi:hypothetical protein